MATYTQTSIIEQNLYDALNDLKYALESPDFKKIISDAESYTREKKMPDNEVLIEHWQIVHDIYACAANNIPWTETQKLVLAYNKYKEPALINRLIQEIYTQQKHRMQPRKIYAAHMMKKAGLTNKKIAQILGCSSTLIAKFLKINLEIKKATIDKTILKYID